MIIIETFAAGMQPTSVTLQPITTTRLDTS
jgi:hypothetical protein